MIMFFFYVRVPARGGGVSYIYRCFTGSRESREQQITHVRTHGYKRYVYIGIGIYIYEHLIFAKPAAARTDNKAEQSPAITRSPRKLRVYIFARSIYTNPAEPRASRVCGDSKSLIVGGNGSRVRKFDARARVCDFRFFPFFFLD